MAFLTPAAKVKLNYASYSYTDVLLRRQRYIFAAPASLINRLAPPVMRKLMQALLCS